MPELGTRARGKQKKIDMAARALAAIDQFAATNTLVDTAAAPLLQDTP
jgi:hypothetical protein